MSLFWLIRSVTIRSEIDAHEFRRGNAQAGCEPHESEVPWQKFATLEFAQVGAAHGYHSRKLALRETALGTQIPQFTPQCPCKF